MLCKLLCPLRRDLPQDLVDGGYGAERALVLGDDLLDLGEFEVAHVADQGLVLTGDGAVGIHDRAGKYLDHKLKLKPDDPYEVIEM